MSNGGWPAGCVDLSLIGVSCPGCRHPGTCLRSSRREEVGGYLKSGRATRSTLFGPTTPRSAVDSAASAPVLNPIGPGTTTVRFRNNQGNESADLAPNNGNGGSQDLPSFLVHFLSYHETRKVLKTPRTCGYSRPN